MRGTEEAATKRLREIVKFVEEMGKGVAVVGNGYCLGYGDAGRARKVAGRFLFLSVTIYRSVLLRSPFRYDRHRCRNQSPLLLPYTVGRRSPDTRPNLPPCSEWVGRGTPPQSRYFDGRWANSRFCGNHVESTRAEEGG